jgi:hypothetical protein
LDYDVRNGERLDVHLPSPEERARRLKEEQDRLRRLRKLKQDALDAEARRLAELAEAERLSLLRAAELKELERQKRLAAGATEEDERLRAEREAKEEAVLAKAARQLERDNAIGLIVTELVNYSMKKLLKDIAKAALKEAKAEAKRLTKEGKQLAMEQKAEAPVEVEVHKSTYKPKTPAPEPEPEPLPKIEEEIIPLKQLLNPTTSSVEARDKAEAAAARMHEKSGVILILRFSRSFFADVGAVGEVRTIAPISLLAFQVYIRAAFSLILDKFPTIQQIRFEQERAYLFVTGSNGVEDGIMAALLLKHQTMDFFTKIPSMELGFTAAVVPGHAYMAEDAYNKTCDIFGRSVEQANMMATDFAANGEILITKDCYVAVECSDNLSDKVVLQIRKEQDKTTMQPVEVAAVVIKSADDAEGLAAKTVKLLEKYTLPTDSEVRTAMSRNDGKGEYRELKVLIPEPKAAAVVAGGGGVNNSLSLKIFDDRKGMQCMMKMTFQGWTRLVAEYGVLHPLTLLLELRKCAASRIGTNHGPVRVLR